MPIYSKKNLYPGINPHLNSALQQTGGGWSSFHTLHLSEIARAVDARLPDGYYTMSETSLQINTYDAQTDIPLGKPLTTIPDVTVYRAQPKVSPSLPSESPEPTLTLPLLDHFDDLEDIHAVMIYRLTEGKFPGKPVTRIEVLSPANKPPGSDHGAYLTKRRATLYSGLRLVEIDYLHERHPVIDRIPSYVARSDLAYPYAIIVSDPRPDLRQGRLDVYGFGVMDPLPTLALPLDDNDRVVVDFDMIYRQTYESSRFFHTVVVDYAQTPVNFDSYTAADRERIRAHMAQIAAEPPTRE